MPLVLPEPSDEHRPQRPVLLAVDQQFAESVSGLRSRLGMSVLSRSNIPRRRCVHEQVQAVVARPGILGACVAQDDLAKELVPNDQTLGRLTSSDVAFGARVHRVGDQGTLLRLRRRPLGLGSRCPSLWQETYAEYGQSLPLDDFITRLGTIGGLDLVAELERLVGTGLDREAVESRRWQRKLELVHALKPRPGILDYIAEARRRGLAVAVVSTDDTEWIMTGLAILGLSDAFDFIECAEGDKIRAKPSPSLYLSALDRLALSAEEAIAIEDSPAGIHAAKAAGLFCVGYASDVTRQLDLSEADIVVDSLDDLPLSDMLHTAAAVR
jgi:HAD superfamily hydrolase (TIGR01509 family)